jgi:hypothetical protein
MERVIMVLLRRSTLCSCLPQRGTDGRTDILAIGVKIPKLHLPFRSTGIK